MYKIYTGVYSMLSNCVHSDVIRMGSRCLYTKPVFPLYDQKDLLVGHKLSNTFETT